jgi:hypothetical protein
MSTGARTTKHGVYFQAVVPGRSHKLAFTGASAALAQTMGAETTLVRAFATQDCWVKRSAAAGPVAVAPTSGTPQPDTIFIAGGIFCYFGVEPGDSLAVIRDSASGNLVLTEAS